jgi:hypothetical protein
MLRRLVCVVLLLPAAAAAEGQFDESAVCSEARAAAAQAAGPDETNARYEVEQARKELGYASERNKAKFQRRLDAAIAELERVRASYRARAPLRAEKAKALSDCVVRERAAFDARAKAKADEQRAAEQRQADQEAARVAAEAQEQERLRSLMMDRTTLHAALSARLCVAVDARAAALREIAAEKKYARYGGYENKAKLYELQQDIRNADESKAAWQKGLKNLRLKAQSCTSAKLKPIIACLSVDATAEACKVGEAAGPFEAAVFLETNGLGPLARADAHKTIKPAP